MSHLLLLPLLLLTIFALACIAAEVIGPLYCYGCGKPFPENKLSFCEDCIREKRSGLAGKP